MREIKSAWPTLCCHIIVLAYENKFNLEAAYGNVYARRAQTVALCGCVCVVLSRPGEGGGKAKLKLAGKLMSHDRDRQRVSERASASCCGRGCNAF